MVSFAVGKGTCEVVYSLRDTLRTDFIVISGDCVMNGHFLHDMADTHRTHNAAVTALFTNTVGVNTADAAGNDGGSGSGGGGSGGKGAKSQKGQKKGGGKSAGDASNAPHAAAPGANVDARRQQQSIAAGVLPSSNK